MTTERRPATRPPPNASIDVKLYVVALLAFAYLVTWWALARRAPRAGMATGAAPSPAAPPRPVTATWYADLPPSSRPAVDLPAGWRIAGGVAPRDGTVRPSTPVPVRVAPARRGRIRTRSS